MYHMQSPLKHTLTVARLWNDGMAWNQYGARMMSRVTHSVICGGKKGHRREHGTEKG